MKRNATAVWNGDLKTGKGELTTESGAVSHVPYSFAKRFETEPGTNPEELIAAAHAGCFTMALSGKLAAAGIVPERLETRGTVSLDKLEAGWTVTGSHLDLVARLPAGADRAAFDRAAEDAKATCPISRLLTKPGFAISMTARVQ